MTRENKLALVVGFGLVLLVGILVSDHFSPARTEAAARLDAAADAPGFNGLLVRPVDRPDPEPARRGGGTARGARAGSGTSPGPLSGGSSRRSADSPATRPKPEAPPVIVMGEPGPEDAGNGSRDGTRPPDGLAPVEEYRITSGDSLERICRRHYDDADLVRALAAFNRIENPALIRLGDVVQLPPVGVLRTGGSAPARASHAARRVDAPAASARTWTYTMKRGDVLSRVVAAHYPASRRQAVMSEIRRLNRSAIPDLDMIREGQPIRMPPRG